MVGFRLLKLVGGGVQVANPSISKGVEIYVLKLCRRMSNPSNKVSKETWRSKRLNDYAKFSSVDEWKHSETTIFDPKPKHSIAS